MDGYVVGFSSNREVMCVVWWKWQIYQAEAGSEQQRRLPQPRKPWHPRYPIPLLRISPECSRTTAHSSGYPGMLGLLLLLLLLLLLGQA